MAVAITGYCTLVEVYALLERITITTTTRVTIDDVSNRINSQADYINGFVGVYYVVPVDETNSPYAYKMLAEINAKRVAADVLTILGESTGEEAIAGADRWLPETTRILEKIGHIEQKKRQPLPDAVERSMTETQSRIKWTAPDKNEDVSEDVDRAFHMDDVY